MINKINTEVQSVYCNDCDSEIDNNDSHPRDHELKIEVLQDFVGLSIDMYAIIMVYVILLSIEVIFDIPEKLNIDYVSFAFISIFITISIAVTQLLYESNKTGYDIVIFQWVKDKIKSVNKI